LVIKNNGLNLFHESRHNLGILAAPHVTRVLDAAGYVSELVFDSFQGTGKDSMLDPTRRDWGN